MIFILRRRYNETYEQYKNRVELFETKYKDIKSDFSREIAMWFNGLIEDNELIDKSVHNWEEMEERIVRKRHLANLFCPIRNGKTKYAISLDRGRPSSEGSAYTYGLYSGGKYLETMINKYTEEMQTLVGEEFSQSFINERVKSYTDFIYSYRDLGHNVTKEQRWLFRHGISANYSLTDVLYKRKWNDHKIAYEEITVKDFLLEQLIQKVIRALDKSNIKNITYDVRCKGGALSFATTGNIRWGGVPYIYREGVTEAITPAKPNYYKSTSMLIQDFDFSTMPFYYTYCKDISIEDIKDYLENKFYYSVDDINSRLKNDYNSYKNHAEEFCKRYGSMTVTELLAQSRRDRRNRRDRYGRY